MSDPFANLRRGHYGAILADPPWRFATWNKATAIKRGHGGFARAPRTGWDVWGNQTDKFAEAAE